MKNLVAREILAEGRSNVYVKWGINFWFGD